MTVVTGRGSRTGGLLTGEALDRAWHLLGNLETRTGAATARILADVVSAGLLETLFELERLTSTASGFALGSERREQDAERRLLGKPTPCVGRELELATLEAIFASCRDELVARSALVLAPPGLGKSRLRHEFVRRLHVRNEPVVILQGSGYPMKVKSAYGLLGEALRQRMEIYAGQDPAEQRARLRERIAGALPTSDALRVTVFIGEICGVRFPDDAIPQLKAARQDPRIMSDQVEQAWLDGLQLMQTQEPLLLILEDLHWSDALTVKLVDLALRRLRDHAFMVLALARPEVQELYPNLWGSVVQKLPLHPLARKAGERLVRQILGPSTGPDQVARIVEQSAGNPPFLEELIRAAAEPGTNERPATVVAMIQSRLGGLPAEMRRTLRAASVFGEAFWENGVRLLLSATPEEEMQPNCLAELVEEEIIEKAVERRFAEETQYRVRHALVRDAAYGLVSDHEKVAWHAAAGRFLERAGEREAVVLAEHCRLGHDLTRAVSSYVMATEQAYRAGDMDAALLCIERGLACGAAGEERGILLSFQTHVGQWREQYDLILAVGREALDLLRPGSEPACRVLLRYFIATMMLQHEKLPELMKEFLLVQPDLAARSTHFQSAARLCIAFAGAGQKIPALTLHLKVVQLKEGLAIDDLPAKASFHAMEGVWNSCIQLLPNTALTHYKASAYAAELSGTRQMQAATQAWTCKMLSNLGLRIQAEQVTRSTLRFAEQLRDEMPLAYARIFLAQILTGSSRPDEWDEARELAQAVLKSRNQNTLAMAHGVLAQLAFYRGDLTTAEAEARIACQLQAATVPYKPELVALLSRILIGQGMVPEALRVCEEAMREQVTLGIEPNGLLSLYAALGEARERAGLKEAARQAIEQALPILAQRVADIPDIQGRAVYLKEVPENALLLELAAKWGLDTTLSA